MISRHRYVVELYRSDNTPVGRAPVRMDWCPAEEWARFMCLRRGWSGSTGVADEAVVEPVWQAEAGEPYVAGLHVSLSQRDGGEAMYEIPLTYFHQRASLVAAVFVERGTLAAGESYKYVVAAFPREQQPAPESGVVFDAEEITANPHITAEEPAAFADLVRGSLGAGPMNAIDFPVFLPREILDETGRISRNAGSVESGGVLIGYLRRASSSEIYAQVTAQIPARHVVAEASKLTFTAETWTDVRAAIHLRNNAEIMLGWWHSHIARELCKDCPEERQRVCRYAGDFFSAHDRALHRAIFPGAYSVALVANDVAFGDVSHSMFGWRQGLLELRGFHVLGAAPGEAVVKSDRDVAYAHQ